MEEVKDYYGGRHFISIEEPKVITIDDVIDSTVLHLIKGTHFLRGNPKGTHTELKGNPVTRLNSDP